MKENKHSIINRLEGCEELPKNKWKKRKKVNVEVSGAKYYYWQDELEKMNKFQKNTWANYSGFLFLDIAKK